MYVSRLAGERRGQALANPAVDRILLLIIGLACLVRLLILLLYAPWNSEVQANEVLQGDAISYHRLAACIASEFSFCDNTHRTPGYPLFVAALYKAMGHEPWVVLVFQILIDVLLIFLTHSLAKSVFSVDVARFAAVLVGFDPITVFGSSSLLTDTLFAVFFVAAVSVFLYGLLQQRTSLGLLAGFLIGISALVRPSSQYLPILFAIAALFWWRSSFYWRAKYAICIPTAFVIAVSPWLVRNYTSFGAIGLSTVQSEALLNWQVAYFLSMKSGIKIAQVRADLLEEARLLGYQDNGNPFVNHKIKQEVALKHIRENLPGFTIATINGVLKMYVNVGSSQASEKLGLLQSDQEISSLKGSSNAIDGVAKIIGEVEMGQLALGLLMASIQLVQYALFAVGVFLMIRGRENLFVLGLFGVLILYFSITPGITSEGRYRIPIAPLYLIIASVSLASLHGSIRARATKSIDR